MHGTEVAAGAAAADAAATQESGGSWWHRFVLDKLRVFLQPSILLLLLGASMRHTGQSIGTGHRTLKVETQHHSRSNRVSLFPLEYA